MKKFLILLLMAMCLVCSLALFACDGAQQPAGHVCDWQSTLSYNETKHFYKCTDTTCNKIKDAELHEYTLDGDNFVPGDVPLNVCACGHSYEADETSITPYDADHVLSRMYDGTVVKLMVGNYGTIRIEGKSNIIIYAGDFVKVELIRIVGNCKNIYIYDIDFSNVTGSDSWEGGVKVQNGENTENVVIKNCTFTDNSGFINDTSTQITNTKIIGCKFYDLGYCSIEGYRSAIVAYYCYGLTVEDCEFDGITKNCIQAYVSGGTHLTIKNNVFKNAGGVTLNLWVYSDQSAVDISSNKFYQEKTSINENPDLTRDEGVYIYSGNRQIAVGANSWEIMPQNINFYLYNVNIDMSAQTLINDQFFALNIK